MDIAAKRETWRVVFPALRLPAEPIETLQASRPITLQLRAHGSYVSNMAILAHRLPEQQASCRPFLDPLRLAGAARLHLDGLPLQVERLGTHPAKREHHSSKHPPHRSAVPHTHVGCMDSTATGYQDDADRGLVSLGPGPAGARVPKLARGERTPNLGSIANEKAGRDDGRLEKTAVSSSVEGTSSSCSVFRRTGFVPHTHKNFRVG